jgi:hypothetical protein
MSNAYINVKTGSLDPTASNPLESVGNSHNGLTTVGILLPSQCGMPID